ncbi:MAG: hypothetical protein AAFQ41_15665 [Cyanobacteria bacterium J06623_7]
MSDDSFKSSVLDSEISALNDTNKVVSKVVERATSLTTQKAQTAENYYYAYGLKIRSVFPLPELIAAEGNGFDVAIKHDSLERSPFTDLEQYWFCCEATEEGLYLYWQGIGKMLVQEGKSITVDPVADYDPGRLRLFILGAALGAILHQRGYIVLHAGAVAIDGQAVIFTAPKGEGKSTMTATLHGRGHGFIADDVVAIDCSNWEQPMVYPAFPQLKLWPDALQQIGRDPEDLPKLIERLEKREYLFQDFSLEPLPLKQIFVLGTGTEIALEPLKSQAVILTLLRNVYVARFGSALMPSKDPAYFLKLTKFAQLAPIVRLLRPRNLALIEQVAKTVEEYVRV